MQEKTYKQHLSYRVMPNIGRIIQVQTAGMLKRKKKLQVQPHLTYVDQAHGNTGIFYHGFKQILVFKMQSGSNKASPKLTRIHMAGRHRFDMLCQDSDKPK